MILLVTFKQIKTVANCDIDETKRRVTKEQQETQE